MITPAPPGSRGRRRRAGLALSLVAAACAAIALVPGSARATTLPSGFAETTLATGFTLPTAVDWAPDGRMFVAEKAGRVKVVNPNGTQATLLDMRAQVNSDSDRGMLGLAVDKDFASNGWLYLLYVRELNPMVQDSDAPMVSRLTRVTVTANNTVVNPAAPETIILGTEDNNQPCPQPDNDKDCIPADFHWHVIGTVRSDPVDGTLWVGTGDTHPPSPIDALSYRPYDEHTYAGKILHVDRQGNGVGGHPFCPTETDLTKVCSKLYAKGFRNPYRFTLRPGKGPVVGDVGNSAKEELDLLKPGRNYGWPCYEGDQRTPSFQNQPRCAQEYAKEGTPDAATPPNYSYARGNGAAIIAGPTYPGGAYPSDYTGDVFIGDYVQGWVKRLEFDSNEALTSVRDFATGWPPGVDLELAPDGNLAYVDIGFGGPPAAVRKFVFAQGNGPPVPRASATPTSGEAPLTVQFDGSGSSDPEGDPLTYRWDFGDGSPQSTAVSPAHTYTAAGSYTARLTVDDGTGRNPSTTVQISVGGNAPPTATITAPADESSYRDGVQVNLTGSASDPEDGTLTGSALSWQVLLHHNTHIHDVSTGTLTGTSANFTPAVDHDADSFYEIRLTATDSDGSTNTKTIEIRPETTSFTLASSPAGAPLTYADSAGNAPFTRTAAVGFNAPISAAESFVKDGRTYSFDRWSDGGARSHGVTIPASPTTLTAHYRTEGVETFTLTPSADTYVSVQDQSVSHGALDRLVVDAEPERRIFIRFPTAAIAGRTVLSASLRLWQVDQSPLGGTVRGVGSNTWAESITWGQQPAIDGPSFASFGAVSSGNSYEVALGAAAVPTTGGAVSYALTSTNASSSQWSSRETANPPQLIVEVASTPPDTTIDSGPNGTTRDATPTFQFSASEAGTFQCRVDGGSFTACSSPFTTTALSHGAHTFRVRAIDSEGTADPTPAERTFSVDLTPENIAAPSISPGSAEEGDELSCSTGTWTNSPTTYAYEWRRDDTPIVGQTSSTYTVTGDDVGHQIVCLVTASNAYGSTTATSASVTPTAQAEPQPEPEPEPEPQPDPEPGVFTTPDPIPLPLPGPGSDPALDTLAPRATLVLRPRQRLAGVIRRGLVLSARCPERCRLDLALLLDRRTARALGFRAAKPVELGRVSRQLQPGVPRRITLRLNRVARRTLRGVGSVRVVLRIRTVDDARNSRVTTRHLTLRG